VQRPQPRRLEPLAIQRCLVVVLGQQPLLHQNLPRPFPPPRQLCRPRLSLSPPASIAHIVCPPRGMPDR